MKRIFLIASLVLFAFASIAQTTMLGSAGSATATVTNTGTDYLTASPTNAHSDSDITISVTATKTSGTVAGTISLLGSADNGVTFKAVLLQNVSTALNTYTATDVASQTFIFSLSNNDYTHYRVSWTGAGTMVATFTAKMSTRLP